MQTAPARLCSGPATGWRSTQMQGAGQHGEQSQQAQLFRNLRKSWSDVLERSSYSSDGRKCPPWSTMSTVGVALLAFVV